MVEVKERWEMIRVEKLSRRLKRGLGPILLICVKTHKSEPALRWSSEGEVVASSGVRYSCIAPPANHTHSKVRLRSGDKAERGEG
jgi:hypothetical protein